MHTMQIEVIEVFQLSRGIVYAIRFPINFLPKTGLVFSYNNYRWKITGINTSSSPHSIVQEKQLIENIWNCIIEVVEDSKKELEIGYIEVLIE